MKLDKVLAVNFHQNKDFFSPFPFQARRYNLFIFYCIMEMFSWIIF